MRFASILTFVLGLGLWTASTPSKSEPPPLLPPVPSPGIECLDWKPGDILGALSQNAIYGPGLVVRAKGSTGTLVFNVWDTNGAGFSAPHLTLQNLGDSSITISQAGKTVTAPAGGTIAVLLATDPANDGAVAYSIGTDGSSSIPNGRFAWVLR